MSMNFCALIYVLHEYAREYLKSRQQDLAQASCQAAQMEEYAHIWRHPSRGTSTFSTYIPFC